MLTKILFRPLLAFTFCILLLLPQIATMGTAFAAKPASVDNVPDLNCLDVAGSTTLSGKVVPRISPPGEEVQFSVLPRVANHCETTVSSIVVTYTISAVCPPPSASDAKPSTFKPDKPLASSQSVGDRVTYGVTCITYSGIVPIASEPPTSISIDVEAKGTNANGQEIFSPVKTVTVPF
jgi:hypothetical protein